jgi:methionyl aminopeptidase
MRRAGRLAARYSMLCAAHVLGCGDAGTGRYRARNDDAAWRVPATLGYRGYTHSCCISINHVIWPRHPVGQKVRRTATSSHDVTPNWTAGHGDTTFTFLVGDVPQRPSAPVDVTYGMP